MNTFHLTRISTFPCAYLARSLCIFLISLLSLTLAISSFMLVIAFLFTMKNHNIEFQFSRKQIQIASTAGVWIWTRSSSCDLFLMGLWNAWFDDDKYARVYFFIPAVPFPFLPFLVSHFTFERKTSFTKQSHHANRLAAVISRFHSVSLVHSPHTLCGFLWQEFRLTEIPWRDKLVKTRIEGCRDWNRKSRLKFHNVISCKL